MQGFFIEHYMTPRLSCTNNEALHPKLSCTNIEALHPRLSCTNIEALHPRLSCTDIVLYCPLQGTVYWIEHYMTPEAIIHIYCMKFISCKHIVWIITYYFSIETNVVIA
jgi:hypothetical protein